MSHSTPEPAEGYNPQRGLTPDEGTAPAGGYEAGFEPAGTTDLTAGTFADPVYSDPAYAVTDPYGDEQGSGASQVKDTAVDQGREVAGTAKEQAGQVKDTAVEQGRQVAGTAKEQAGQVKDTAVEQVGQVADVARSEAGQVKQEATTQLRDLLSQSRTELSSQAGTQQNRLAEYVHSLSDELGTMASGGSDGTGQLADLAHRGARTGGELAHWLSEHEPADVLDEVTRFARRRPFAFLGASLLAGVVVGRVTRSLAAEKKDEHDAQRATDLTSTPAVSGSDYAAPLSTPATGYAPTGYDAGTATGYPATGYQQGGLDQPGYGQTGDEQGGHRQGEYAQGGTTGGYGTGDVPGGLPESPAPQGWTGGTR